MNTAINTLKEEFKKLIAYKDSLFRYQQNFHFITFLFLTKHMNNILNLQLILQKNMFIVSDLSTNTILSFIRVELQLLKYVYVCMHVHLFFFFLGSFF